MFPFILVLLTTIHVSMCFNNKSNVCKNSYDYFYLETSPNCWYEPDMDATMIELITNKGYPFEEYKVTSDDGYITTLFRMPKVKPNKGVVYLLHPATGNPSVWLNRGQNGSLAFLLYDAGFDVWLGNSRGTENSREHVTLSDKNSTYWDFSFHEMAIYDLPKQMEFIKNVTGSKVAFAGHSMGGTIGFVYPSMRPNHAKKHVNVFALLSAGGHFKKIKVPLMQPLSWLINHLYAFLRTMNYMKLMSIEDNLIKMSLDACRSPFGLNTCPIYSKLALGFTDTVWDPAFLAVALAHYPSSVPAKAYAHYGQWLRSSDHLYRQFDYGKYLNKKIYKSKLPPKYPIDKIKTPIFVVSGRNDWLSTPEGVEEFYNMLPDEAKIYGRLEIEEFNHSDVLMASNAVEAIYKPLIRLFEKVFAKQ